MYFDPNKFYRPDDLHEIAAKTTLEDWRHENRGPAYIKAGSRVIYYGAHLNEWLETRTVTPAVP